MNHSSKILIVGASGYIGKSLYEKSKTLGVAYGTSTTGQQGLLRLCLASPEDFDYDILQPNDVVIVTAAISAPDICARQFDHAWNINVTGTSYFLSKVIARGAKVLFFSSDTVYGERDDEFDERSNCNPAGEYAVMKHEVEKLFLSNPLFKVLRLSYVFSREDKFSKYLSGCQERSEEAEIFHPFYRAVIYRNDVVDGALALAQKWGSIPQNIINFGGPAVVARTEFAQILQETALSKLRFRITEPEADFFHNRPRVIRMLSPILETVLGRTASTLREASIREFN